MELGQVEPHKQVFVLSHYLTGKAHEFYIHEVAGDSEKWGIHDFFLELFNVMLSLGRDKHEPCRVKGSFYVKIQVDIKVFQHSNLDRVASRIQGFRDRAPTQK